MPDPLIKWAKRNTHSDPPLFPWGLKRLTRPLLSLLPPTRKGGKKVSFFTHQIWVFCILPVKMSSIIPLPFKCFPVPRNAYEEFWNSEHGPVFEMFSTTPLNGRNQMICDGDHSTTVGYHQQCCVPPVACIPDSSWFCPECSSERRDVASELADPNYAPSSHPTTSAPSTCSASSSASESDSNTSSDSSNDTSSSDSDSSDVSSLTSASQSSVAAGGQGGALHLLNFFLCYGM